MNFNKRFAKYLLGIVVIAAILSLPSCKKNISVEGTLWTAVESDGDRYTFRFYPGGRLGYTSPTGTYNDSDDTWVQVDIVITMSFNNGYATRQGTISGKTMSGTGWNINGLNWTWTATKQGNL